MPEHLRYVGEPGLGVIKAIAALMIDQEVGDWPSHGDNPKVFHAELGPVDQYGMRALVMTFYRSTRVFVAFQPTGVSMPHRTLGEATPDDPIEIGLRFD